MIKYIGNTRDLIDWDSVIKLCQENNSPDVNTVTSVVDRSEAEAVGDNKLLESYRKVIGTWRDAGYDLKDIVWYDYYPGQHFSLDVQTIFSEIVEAKPLRVFISEVMPGKIVPYHWDVEDKEDEWLSNYGMLYRYVCCVDKFREGSVLVFDHTAIYHHVQGDIFLWNNYKDYHSAANAGASPQYYFHFLGYK